MNGHAPYTKIISTTCLVFLVAILVVNYSANYSMGFEESSFSILADPVMMGIPWLLIATFLILTWVSSLIRRKCYWWTTAMATGLVVLMAIEHFAPGARGLIVYGLRDRVMQDYGLDGLRRFARDVNQNGLLRDGGGVSHGDISQLSDSEKTAYEELEQKYTFLHWMSGSTSILNYQDNNVVNFEWGGALSGHWGCSITIDGQKNESEIESGSMIVPVSDDIYFYLTPD
jgi:hypothetical protein